MVEKAFFVEHATQEVKHAVMSSVRPYPDTKTLQRMRNQWQINDLQ